MPKIIDVTCYIWHTISMSGETFTTEQTAKAFGVTTRTIIRWEEVGRLVPFNRTPGGRKQYSREQIEELNGKLPGSTLPAWTCKNCGSRHVLDIDTGLRLVRNAMGPTCVEYGPPKESVCA